LVQVARACGLVVSADGMVACVTGLVVYVTDLVASAVSLLAFALVQLPSTSRPTDFEVENNCVRAVGHTSCALGIVALRAV
jgi:hypothetical protein